MITNYKNYLKKFRSGSKSFSFAAFFLPSETRNKISYLYYLCRIPDDIADGADSRTMEDFLAKASPDDFFKENSIPKKYYTELISGIKSDINFVYKSSIEDFLEYCHLVAGTVGIMSAYILGFRDKRALEYAKDLGIAMQITNILRDVQQDATLGRIYFPLEDLARFGVSKDDIFEHRFTKGVRSLMHYYEQLALQYYDNASIGIKYLSTWQSRLCARIALNVYKGILFKIRKNNFNPFLGRVYVEPALKVYYAFSALKNEKS